MMDCTHGNFFQGRQKNKQNEEHQRMVQRRPDERPDPEAPTKVECAPDEHELCENEGLDRGDAPCVEAHARISQDRGLQQYHRAEADVEIEGKGSHFLEFVHRLLAKGRGFSCHVSHSVLSVSRRYWQTKATGSAERAHSSKPSTPG